MTDSEKTNTDLPGSPEQLPEPSQQSQQLRSPTLREIQQTHEMLVGFRKGIREATFKGEFLVHVAQGMAFLDNMVAQSQGQYEMAIRMQKEAEKQAKEASKKMEVVN
jgi:hypothetical protein